MHLSRNFVLLLGLVALAACGGGSNPPYEEEPPSPAVYKGTQSPGDVWTYTLTGDLFSARNETIGLDYSGGVAPLSNGYMRLDVTASTDPSLVLPSTAYALEHPGVALFVIPAGSDPQVIVCCAVGSTPTAETSYNYVKLPDPDWGTGAGGVDTEEAWGVGESHISGASGEIFNFYSDIWDMGNLTDVPTESSWAPETYTASGGWLIPDVGDARIAMTPSGIFIQDGGPGQGGGYGIVAPASNLGLGALFTADRDFLGYVFHYDDPSDDTQAVWASAAVGDAYFTGGSFVTSTGSFDDAVPGDADGRFTLTSEVRPGVFRGMQTEPGPDGVLGTADDVDRSQFVMLMAQIAGRYFLFGIIEPVSGVDMPVNFIAFEQ